MEKLLFIAIGVAISEIRGLIQRSRARKKEVREQRHSHHALLSSLRAELDQTQAVITEIAGIVANRRVAAKRISRQIIEQARVELPRYDTDRVFLRQLATAYDDIILTNAQLDSLQQHGEVVRPIAEAVMRGVAASVNSLSDTLDAKITSLQNP